MEVRWAEKQCPRWVLCPFFLLSLFLTTTSRGLSVLLRTLFFLKSLSCFPCPIKLHSQNFLHNLASPGFLIYLISIDTLIFSYESNIFSLPFLLFWGRKERNICLFYRSTKRERIFFFGGVKFVIIVFCLFVFICS